MKKAVILSLIFIYALSSTGFAIKADFCCNTLKSVKLVLADAAKDKEGCVKTKYQSLKVKDTHAAADISIAPASPVAFIHSVDSFFRVTSYIHKEAVNLINVHAPPLDPAFPVYLSNCAFRI
ncbi:MAG: hypothetical protein ACTHJ5_19190 [Ilyomonas sp.]